MHEYTFHRYKVGGLQGNRPRARASASSEKYVGDTAPERYREALKPNYPMGCKRIILDSGYLTALHDKKMHLIIDPVSRIERNHVVTKSGVRHHADLIVSVA